MDIKDKERELFNEWKAAQGYSYFISDGILDENEWNKQDYKILFVLKEANWEGGNTDLCEFLLSEASPTYWKTWNNVARWTKAILEGGDAVAENDTIYSFAEKDKVLLKRQIELYEPDIIICCGRGKGKNADILHDIVFEKNEVSEWKEPMLQYDYFLAKINNRKSIPVVSFYHPQMRGGHELFMKRYEEMKYLAKELKERYR